MMSIIEYLERGPSTSKEIQAATALSQSSVSRMLKKMDDSIVQIQDGRSVRYAATCNAFGCNDKLPLNMIDHLGVKCLVAYLRPLNCGQFFVEILKDEFSSPLKGESRTGLYDDLPYFLLDLKPQGFLGRQIAKMIAEQSEDFPSNPKAWNTNHVGRYLISNGEDLPGNLILGEQTLLRVQRRPMGVSIAQYPELAENAVKGEPPGSSAGGEQPKFTAFNKDLNSHVIVKFSPKSDNEVAARWRDLLITEYHAANVLSENDYPAAVPILFEIEGRFFLESPRFDRIGEFGRSSMISLDMVDREFVGFGGSNWHRVMEDLLSQRLVSEKDTQISRELQYFGRLINNTDMHLGNLSLSMEGNYFRLLPVYDMCSMGFAPKSGEVLPFNFKVPMETDLDIDRAETVQKMAYQFWENITDDDRVSEQFRAFLDLNNPMDLSGDNEFRI